MAMAMKKDRESSRFCFAGVVAQTARRKERKRRGETKRRSRRGWGEGVLLSGDGESEVDREDLGRCYRETLPRLPPPMLAATACRYRLPLATCRLSLVACRLPLAACRYRLPLAVAVIAAAIANTVATAAATADACRRHCLCLAAVAAATAIAAALLLPQSPLLC